MAATQTGRDEENSTLQSNENKVNLSTDNNRPRKKRGFLAFLFPVLLAASIVFGVWGYFIKSNKFGLGEMFRDDLKNIPVLNRVLPPSPDPEAAEYMSDIQLAQKYEEFRQKVKEMTRQLEEQKKIIENLQSYKDNEQKMLEEVSRQKTDNEKERERIEVESKKLEEEKLKFAEQIKSADEEGFVAFFENMDKDIAAQIYEKIQRERMVDKEVKDFVKTFDSMEPASAAQLLEHMGLANMDLVANIMKLMKKQVVAEVLANMDPVFAANLADRMAVEYPIYPEEYR